jgi:hypothetical protein
MSDFPFIHIVTFEYSIKKVGSLKELCYEIKVIPIFEHLIDLDYVWVSKLL